MNYRLAFENRAGVHLFRQVCGRALNGRIPTKNVVTVGAKLLEALSVVSPELPELRNVISIPDGGTVKAWRRRPKGLLVLPGNERPETLIFRHLFTMSEADPFWKTCGATYSREFAINRQGAHSIEQGDHECFLKTWYGSQSLYWGRANARVFQSWVQAHKPECLAFCKRLFARCGSEIPGDVVVEVFAQFED